MQDEDLFAPRFAAEPPAWQPQQTNPETPALPPADADEIETAATRLLGRKPDGLWAYCSERGQAAFYVARLNNDDGQKVIRPLSWFENGGWRLGSWPDNRPLHNLPQVIERPGASIVVVEGEKAADAATCVFPNSVVVTSSGGAQAASKTDWAPLAKRRVVIWPDNDDAGAKYARDVATTLTKFGCDVSIVAASELASLAPSGDKREPAAGFDAADAIGEWADIEAQREAVANLARPFDPGTAFVSFGPFEMSADGLTVEIEKGRGETKKKEPVFVAAAFEILGACRDPKGRQWGKWLRWRDGDGRAHLRHVTDAALQGDAARLCADLAAEGLPTVWGRGAPNGYVRTWRATANGLEGAAAAATDTALILDELGQVEARDAAPALYSLSNGTGKARSARDGSLREPKSWRVMFLSSGEIPVETKLKEEWKRKARAGQLVRLLDIPAERPHGVFDDAGPDGDAAALSKAFKQAAVSAYGTAGPEFVRRLSATGDMAERVQSRIRDFVAANVESGADGQIYRAAERFGLIATAGELAIELGVAPWRVGEAQEAAVWALTKWIEGRGGTQPAEVRQAINQVRLFIEQHGDSRFDSLDARSDHPVHNRAGWRKGAGGEQRWLIPPATWREGVCVGLDSQFVARVLAERGMLERGADGYSRAERITGSTKRVYAVTSRVFDGGDRDV